VVLVSVEGVVAMMMVSVSGGWRGGRGGGGVMGMRNVNGICIRVHALWDGDALELFVVDRGAKSIIQNVLLGIVTD
jgi:hypothetical protein